MIHFLQSRKIQLPLFAGAVISFMLVASNAYAEDPPLKIVSGNSHSCLITATNHVECWGDNTYGQLGRLNTADDNSLNNIKQEVANLTDVYGLALGDNHTCAMGYGWVKCWGANNEGQLGNGSLVDSYLPVAVQGMTNVQSIVAGAAHTCIHEGGQGVVKCWGRNSSGQLGIGTKSPYVTTPQKLKKNAADLFPTSSQYISEIMAAGTNHTCTTFGLELYCWGANESGQLLGGSTVVGDQVFPVLKPRSYNDKPYYSYLSAGTSHTCFVDRGYLTCGGNWGGATYVTPQNIRTFNEPTSLVSGKNHICYTMDSTTLPVKNFLHCFGQNLDGQTGIGSLSSFVDDANLPDSTTVVALNSNVLAVSAGGSQSCALLENHSIACWGLNGMGQLGDGTHRRALTPVSAGWWTHDVIASGVDDVGIGYSHTCALKAGQVKCWGNNANGQVGTGAAIGSTQATPVPVTGLLGFPASLVTGNQHNCVMNYAGQVRCWGDNSSGQLGNGNYTSQATPVLVSLGAPATSIIAAGDFTCATFNNGTVKCWGSNSHGQLGIGSAASDNPFPTLIPNLTGVTALSGKLQHACAILSNRTVKCWGANYSSQLGDGTTINRNTPVSITSTWIDDVIAVSAGTDNTCILREGYGTWCWGAITGNGTATVRSRPIDVASLYNVVDISAGDFNTCAIISNGSVKCFGKNAPLLGDGTDLASSGNSYFPNSVRWLSAPARKIVHGRLGNACAILVTGELACWGANRSGQFGAGSTRNEPVIVNL